MKTKQVEKAQMNTLPYIIAVDFDGTLFQDSYPEIGEPNHGLICGCIEYREKGGKLILWTCRDNDTPEMHLDKAVAACKEHGLEFDAVNRNIDEVIIMFNNDTRKIYANEYIDDKAVEFEVPSHWLEVLEDGEGNCDNQLSFNLPEQSASV